MSNPLALVTVTFSRPITGSELMEAVKELSHCGEDYLGTSFEASQRFDNGEVFTISRYSRYPSKQLLVAPSTEQHEIRLDETYGQIEVMSHSWPKERFAVGYEESAVVSTVRDFAQRLEQHFADPSRQKQPTESSVWPQEVTVCALCGRIVTRLLEGVTCSQDGNNPPTKLVKVVPATS